MEVAVEMTNHLSLQEREVGFGLLFCLNLSSWVRCGRSSIAACSRNLAEVEEECRAVQKHFGLAREDRYCRYQPRNLWHAGTSRRRTQNPDQATSAQRLQIVEVAGQDVLVVVGEESV